MIRTKPMQARDSHEPHRAATELELFFDLASVIAIAAATASFHHAISEGHGLDLLPNYVFLFISIWWAWMNYTWFASGFDNDDAVYRLLTILILSGALMFAGGAGHIVETMDFGLGLVGWIVMRIGMACMWFRAARHNPSLKKLCLRYGFGLCFAQVLWVASYLVLEPGSPEQYAITAGIFLVEFSIPVFAERAGGAPFHRHHIVERYGLLNIIVLGEVLLAISLVFGKLYGNAPDLDLILAGGAGIVIVFSLWWIYFLEEEHLNGTAILQGFVWGYGHVFVFFAGSLLGAGLAAHLDVITHHSEASAQEVSAYIGAAVALYLGALWLVRDQYHDLGIRKYALPVMAVVCVGGATVGVPISVYALVCALALLWRMSFSRVVSTV